MIPTILDHNRMCLSAFKNDIYPRFPSSPTGKIHPNCICVGHNTEGSRASNYQIRVDLHVISMGAKLGLDTSDSLATFKVRSLLTRTEQHHLQLLEIVHRSTMSEPSYFGTIRKHHKDFQQGIDSGTTLPFVLPLSVINYQLLILYLAYAKRWSLPSRIAILVSVTLHSIICMRYCRSTGLAYGVVVGVAGAWSILLTFNLLFIHNPKIAFQRVIALDEKSSSVQPVEQSDRPKEDITWQPMPPKSLDRLFWILDLLGSLRLLHWSIEYQNDRPRQFRNRSGRYDKQVLTVGNCVRRLCLIYLAIDVLKEVVAADPYFWGFVDADLPGHIIDYVKLPILGHVYRMLVAMVLIYLAITLITSAGHLLFILVLGPSIAGTWGHEWAYRPQHGGLMSIYQNGLRGFWGVYWHQMFRPMFTSFANAAVVKLQLEMNSLAANLVRVFVPFTLSGMIHACGSYTLFGATKPSNAFLFFLLQPLGLLLQSLCDRVLDGRNKSENTSYHIQGVTNLIFSLTWMLITFPLLADDFARGGLYLSEPFPVSVCELLGLGAAQRSGTLWLHAGMKYHAGHFWWQSGIAL